LPMSTPIGPIEPKRARLLCLLTVFTVGLLPTLSCTSKKLDPRCKLAAPYEHREEIAQFINGSNLWEAYLDYLSPVKEGAKPVVEIDLTFEREITRETSDGDYDPGIVHANLEVKNLVSGQTVLTDYDKFAIKDFVFGGFENATREEIQAAAFAATEENAMRFILYSLEMAVITGMREEGAKGSVFIPALEKKAEDQWAGDMAGDAKLAIKAIRAPLQ